MRTKQSQDAAGALFPFRGLTLQGVPELSSPSLFGLAPIYSVLAHVLPFTTAHPLFFNLSFIYNSFNIFFIEESINHDFGDRSASKGGKSCLP